MADASGRSEPIHAGLIALYDRGAWKGVLIEGESGSGKSDLALRCLHLGFRLVADDRTRLWVSQGRLFGASPEPIAGLIEARGLGVIPVEPRRFAEVTLVVRCIMSQAPLERMPAPCSRTLLGVVRPLIAVRSLEASTPQKVFRALSPLGAWR